VQGITDLITVPGLINLDFADVRTIVQDAGTALMGIGVGRGENRAHDAADAAINSPLLETSIQGAKGILLNITGGADVSLYEVNDAAGLIADAADDDANIIFGAVVDERLEGTMAVTVVATGFGEGATRREAPPADAGPRPKSPGREPEGTPFERPPRYDGDFDIPSFVRQPEE
jgi:cell division protein FtsZ